MELDDDRCYEALQTRDARFDGSFFTAVTSTGIYCRPVCPARTPARRNVRFYRHAAGAQEAGFRPCRRCRPDAAPGSAEWDPAGDIVTRALRLIDDGVLDDGDIDTLAARVNVGARHLRRLFHERVGATPTAVARLRRTQLARRLIDETDLPITDIAFAAGFGSIRQFNDAMKETFRQPPSELRRPAAGRRADGGPITLRLPFRTPLDWDGSLKVLAYKTTAGVEAIDTEAATYRRTVPGGTVTVRPGTDRHLLLDADIDDVRHLAGLVARARAMFDLDADAETITDALRADPELRPVVDTHPGVRVMGSWDGFETAVRVVLGQLVSVSAATTVAGRLAGEFGTALADAAEDDHLTHRFPTAEQLIGQEVERIGLTRAKGNAIRALAEAVLHDDLALDAGADPDELHARLLDLPGIGPWTADMVRLRVSRDPDAFVPGDLGIRQALGGVTEAEARTRSEAWRPWRAYACMYLWRKL